MSADQHNDHVHDQQEEEMKNQDKSSGGDDDITKKVLDIVTEMYEDATAQKKSNKDMFDKITAMIGTLEGNLMTLDNRITRVESTSGSIDATFKKLNVEVSAKLLAVQSTNEELKSKFDNLYRIIDGLSNSLSLVLRRLDGVISTQSRLNNLISGIRNLIIDSGF